MTTTANQIRSRRVGRTALTLSVIAFLFSIAAATAGVMLLADCSSPAATVSNAISGALQRANEQPGTGYVANPRQ